MSRPPHLLVFSEYFIPPDRLVGGVLVSVYHQVRVLARHWRVTVVAPQILLPPTRRYAAARRMVAENLAARGKGSSIPGVRVLYPRYLHVPVLYPLTEPLQLALIGMWAWIRHASDARLVHAHRLYPPGLTGVLVARVAHLPVVVTAHGSDLHTWAMKGHRVIRHWTRRVLGSADRVVTVSRELYAIARDLGVEESRLRYVPNGVEVEAFESGETAKARPSFDLPADGRVIVCIGALLPVKGHAVLIGALGRLRDREVRLVIAGDGPLRSRLEAQVRAEGLQERVRFINAVPYGRIPDLVAAADLVALPSWNEGMPLTALEALAAGKPLVGSAVGGTREIVEHGRHGLLVPPGDVEALAAALDEALARRWDAESLRARARQYSWSRIAGELEQIYAEISPTIPEPGSPASGG